MNFEKDIDKPLLYWTHRVLAREDRHTTFWGRPFAATHGFGSDDQRCFEGSIGCIATSGDRSFQDVFISEGHTTHGGFFWSIQNHETDSFPATPFLIMNLLDLRFSGEYRIRFECSQNWAELEESSKGIEEYLLCTAEWIGVLLVDKVQANNEGTITLFSNRETTHLAPHLSLLFADNPEEVFGKISALL